MFAAADLDVYSTFLCPPAASNMMSERQKKWQRRSNFGDVRWNGGKQVRGAHADHEQGAKKKSTYGWKEKWFYGGAYYWHPDAEHGALYRKVYISGTKSGFVYQRMSDRDWALEIEFFYRMRCYAYPFSVLDHTGRMGTWCKWQRLPFEYPFRSDWYTNSTRRCQC